MAHNAFVGILVFLVVELARDLVVVEGVIAGSSMSRSSRSWEWDEAQPRLMGAGAVVSLQIMQCSVLLLAPQHAGFGKHEPMKHGELLA